VAEIVTTVLLCVAASSIVVPTLLGLRVRAELRAERELRGGGGFGSRG
jgi:hypothetical protein